MSEVVLMDNVSNILTNRLSLRKAHESLLKTERYPEQGYKENTQVDEQMEIAVTLP